MTPELRRKVEHLISDHSHAEKRLAEEEEALAQAEKALAVTEEAQTILQGIAQEVQQIAHKRVARVVSRCLRAVYGERAYRFEIVFERKRGKTEARLVFSRKGMELDPMDDVGGGVVEVAAFALRVARLLLSVTPCRKLLVMDEPFRSVGEKQFPAIRELLESLAQELGIQFLLVTHNSAFQLGKVINLENL